MTQARPNSLQPDSCPKVSVIGAVYNHEAFIVRAIESILAQDYPNLEVIMVDDGSTDATPELVKPYLDRITYIWKENGGVVSTVNRLYEEVTGEFIVVCGGDDELPPNRIWKHVEHMLAHPEAGVVYGDLELIDADSNLINPSWFGMAGFTPPSGRILSQLFRENCVGAGGLTMRTSVVPSFWPIPAGVGFEDWWTVVNVAAVSELHYLPDVVYRYRFHGANMYLGAQAEQQIEQRRKEIHFRRSILTAPFAADVETDALVECYSRLEQTIGVVAAATAAAPQTLVESDVAASSSALLPGLQALAAGDYETAVRHAVLSLAWDPWNAAARETVKEAGALLALRQEGLGEETKTKIVAARASEILGNPELLISFCREFSAADDVTLVVHARREELAAFSELAEREGLAADDGVDILVTTESEVQLLIACASAALGSTLPSVRSFSAGELDELRALIAA